MIITKKKTEGKMKKLLLVLFLCLMMLHLCCCDQSKEEEDDGATSDQDKEEEGDGATEESVFLFSVDGEEYKPLVEPISEGEEILVSLDDLRAVLDADFTYDESVGLITVEGDSFKLDFILDYDLATVNKKIYNLKVFPKLIEGKVMLPLYFLADHTGYLVSCEEGIKTLSIEKWVLIPDEPESDYYKWAIARARQLTEFRFTPLKDIPTHSSAGKGVFKAGEEYKGFPYSSAERNDKFLCENVSFETFLSALANPDSVLYTKDIYNGNNGSTYYGIVCNSFVRYCLGIRQRCNTKNWLDIPGMSVVAQKGEYTVDELELCDVLHAYGEGPNHVAIVTGIFRDKSGKVREVEVCDAVKTNCRRKTYTESEFYTKWEKYKLCRYENIESIPPFDEQQNDILYNSGIEKTTPVIAVDYGNKSNYFYGETTVISSFADGENTIQIFRAGELIEEISVNGYEKIERVLEKGYYTVRLKGTEYFTEFCVVKPEITHTVANGVITLNVSSGDSESKILFMEYRGKGQVFSGLVEMIPLTEEECESGVIVRTLTEGAYTYKVSFENKYGIWTHTIIQIYE